MKRGRSILVLIVSLYLTAATIGVAKEQMIVGIDTKVEFRREGIIKVAPGVDRVLLFDIATAPLEPLLIADVPLANSAFGPPTNVAITPDGDLAIVANSVNWKKSGDAWESTSDNKIHLLDLTGERAAVVDSLEGADQPSGLAVSADGNWVAVANRASRSVSLLKIVDRKLVHKAEADVRGEAAAIAFCPDGKRLLVTKFAEHAVAVLARDQDHLRYDEALDLTVGRWPYNVQITPNGQLALVANNGKSGQPDGHTDTVSIVDLASMPPRVIDHVVVGDAPEGLAISPNGKLALVALLEGSAPTFEDKWFYNSHGSVAVLAIDGKRVRKIDTVAVGRFPEGVGFSRDGRHAYVGDMLDSRLSILNIKGNKVSNSGKTVALPGKPVSLRTQLP